MLVLESIPRCWHWDRREGVMDDVVHKSEMGTNCVFSVVYTTPAQALKTHITFFNFHNQQPFFI